MSGDQGFQGAEHDTLANVDPGGRPFRRVIAPWALPGTVTTTTAPGRT